MGLDQYDPAEWNRYSYARNNPVLYGDPLGLSAGALTLNPPVTQPWPQPRQQARGGGGPLAEYALIASLAIGTAAGVAAVGRATYCNYTLVYSFLLAIEKDGPLLLALEPMTQPQCVIPIHKVVNPWVGAHIMLAQYGRGKPMMVNYLGHGADVWDRKKVCASIRPLIDAMNTWMPPASRRDQWSCDEYPFFTTVQGGLGASTMPVPQFDNSSHGGRLRAFYYGTNYQGRDILPGEPFAVIVTF